jgi:hypothetical protein
VSSHALRTGVQSSKYRLWVLLWRGLCANRSPRPPWPKFKKPGHYAVGGGCYLQIAAGGTRSWVLRYTLNGRARYMGLGSANLVSLAEARAKARDARHLLLHKIDPIEARRAQHRERLLETARGKTFRECAEGYIASHEPAGAIHGRTSNGLGR